MKAKVEIIKLIQSKKYVEAENLINSSQKEDQLDNELIFLQGIIKANQKKYMEAKNLFKKFLQSSNDHFDGNFNLAGCYHEMGDLENSKSILDELMKSSQSDKIKNNAKALLDKFSEK